MAAAVARGSKPPVADGVRTVWPGAGCGVSRRAYWRAGSVSCPPVETGLGWPGWRNSMRGRSVLIGAETAGVETVGVAGAACPALCWTGATGWGASGVL